MIMNPTEEDLEVVAQLHQKYISGYLRNLGKSFLIRFYTHYLNLPGGILVIDKEGDEIGGFMAAYMNADGMFLDLLKESKLSLVIPVLMRLFTHPAEIFDLIELMNYCKRASLPGVEGELVFACLNPDLKKKINKFQKEIANRLTVACLSRLVEKGAKKIKVCADEDNRPIEKLILRSGFKLVKQFIMRRHIQNLYVRPDILEDTTKVSNEIIELNEYLKNEKNTGTDEIPYIRRADEKDINYIALIHCKYIEGFLRKIGQPFLKNFYEFLVKFSGTVILVAEHKGEIVGFIAGYTPTRNLFSKIVWKSNFFLVFSILIYLVGHPGEIIDFIELIRYEKQVRLKDVDGELLFIAIEPSVRKIGIADQLVEECCKYLYEKGAKKIKVSADKDNDGPNNLLQRLGFNLTGEFQLRGRVQNLYVR